MNCAKSQNGNSNSSPTSRPFPFGGLESFPSPSNGYNYYSGSFPFWNQSNDLFTMTGATFADATRKSSIFGLDGFGSSFQGANAINSGRMGGNSGALGLFTKGNDDLFSNLRPLYPTA